MYVRMYPEHFFVPEHVVLLLFPKHVVEGSSVYFLMDKHPLYQIQNRWFETVDPETLDPPNLDHRDSTFIRSEIGSPRQ